MSKQFYKVEFDPKFFGGDYAGQGNQVLIPEELVRAKGMSQAFHETTGHDSANIIHYSEDTLYNAQGVSEGMSEYEPQIQLPAIPEIEVAAVPAIELPEIPVIAIEPEPAIVVEAVPALESVVVAIDAPALPRRWRA